MATAVGGVIFALLHLREWMSLIHEGVGMFHNPWGNDLFGAPFFTITGLHLTHVTIGVIVLLVVGMRYKGGRFDADDLEITGLYWHFVAIVAETLFVPTDRDRFQIAATTAHGSARKPTVMSAR